MKRFFSLALAMLLSLSVITVNASAITTQDIERKGSVNVPVTLTLTDFAQKSTAVVGSISHITLASLPTTGHGALTVGGNAVGAGQEIPAASLSSLGLVFTPANNFTGEALFTWSATDTGNFTSGTSRATIDYTVARPVVAGQTIKLTMNATVDGKLTASDPAGLPLTYAIVSGPSHGDLIFSTMNGTFTYKPDRDYVGNDIISFTASNPYATSVTADVIFVVGNVKAPVAESASFDVEMRKSVTATLTAMDPNTPPLDLTYTVITQPTKGRLSLNADTGRFTYEHNTDKLVRDTFTFRVSNGYLTSSTVTVTININTPDPLDYRDMRQHWGKLSAGTLAILDLTVGQQVQNMYYYRPEGTMTRAEYAIFLNSIMQIPLAPSTATSIFDDVKAPYLVQSLNASYDNGVTAGTMVGTHRYFYPNKAITRIEAMKMLDNAMKFASQSNQQLSFTDSDLIPSWAVQSVQNLVGYKIVSGSGGYLRPLDLITRAEAAQMLFLAYLERKN